MADSSPPTMLAFVFLSERLSKRYLGMPIEPGT